MKLQLLSDLHLERAPHFAAPCAAPRVEATLSYLRFPYTLAEARGWDNPPVVMATVSR